MFRALQQRPLSTGSDPIGIATTRLQLLQTNEAKPELASRLSELEGGKDSLPPARRHLLKVLFATNPDRS
jgi:hypothetical protein